ncbi:unnamed protein product [Sphagnum balticum]
MLVVGVASGGIIDQAELPCRIAHVYAPVRQIWWSTVSTTAVVVASCRRTRFTRVPDKRGGVWILNYKNNIFKYSDAVIQCPTV